MACSIARLCVIFRLSPVTTNKVVFADDAKMREYIHPDMLADVD